MRRNGSDEHCANQRTTLLAPLLRVCGQKRLEIGIIGHCRDNGNIVGGLHPVASGKRALQLSKPSKRPDGPHADGVHWFTPDQRAWRETESAGEVQSSLWLGGMPLR
jgi:hypothetical protein